MAFVDTNRSMLTDFNEAGETGFHVAARERPQIIAAFLKRRPQGAHIAAEASGVKIAAGALSCLCVCVIYGLYFQKAFVLRTRLAGLE